MSDPGTEQPPLGVPDDPRTDDPFAIPSDDPADRNGRNGTPKENPSG